MGVPKHLRRPVPEWKKELAKYDLKRMGLEILNNYIVFKISIEGINLEGYKRRLLSSGASSPYIAVAQSVIRVSYPDLGEYDKFLLGWESQIKEGPDALGNAFNPDERKNWWNYHKSSMTCLLLDLMYEWRRDLKIGDCKEALGGRICRLTKDYFDFIHTKTERSMVVRPPMKDEEGWINQMIFILGPFVVHAWDMFYYREAGRWLNIYFPRKYKDQYEVEQYRAATKLYVRPDK
jgi:hypothetical protein